MFGPRIRVSHVEIHQNNMCPANSILIACRSTNELPDKRNTNSSSHVSKTSEKPFSMKRGCTGCVATTLIRGERTSDSSSPPLKTLWKGLFDEIRLYRLPSNHSHSRLTDLGFDFCVSKKPREPYSTEIRAYRLPRNHSDSRGTDLGFEFPATNYP